MGGALGSFEELAPCCAAEGGGSTPTCCAAHGASSAGPRRAAALSDDAQEMRKLQQEAQAALHPSEARVSALFDLYDADGNGSLDPEEVKNVMLDVYKSAIAALTERSQAATGQAQAAAVAANEVDFRWAEGQRTWAADAPEREACLDARSAASRRQKIAEWHEADVKNRQEELNRHYRYLVSQPASGQGSVLELMAALDKDMDGRVDKDEFLEGFCQHMRDSFAPLDDAELDAQLDESMSGGALGAEEEDGGEEAGVADRQGEGEGARRSSLQLQLETEKWL